MCFVMAGYLAHLNKSQEDKRVSAGQQRNAKDTSIMTLKQAAAHKAEMQGAMTAEEKDQDPKSYDAGDLTDIQNINFHYVRESVAFSRVPKDR